MTMLMRASARMTTTGQAFCCSPGSSAIRAGATMQTSLVLDAALTAPVLVIKDTDWSVVACRRLNVTVDKTDTRPLYALGTSHRGTMSDNRFIVALTVSTNPTKACVTSAGRSVIALTTLAISALYLRFVTVG